MNLPGSYEAFLLVFAPEVYQLLVVLPRRRRRARVGLAVSLAAVLVAACCWALAGSVLTSRHVPVARGHHHHARVVPRDRDADHDAALGTVV